MNEILTLAQNISVFATHVCEYDCHKNYKNEKDFTNKIASEVMNGGNEIKKGLNALLDGGAVTVKINDKRFPADITKMSSDPAIQAKIRTVAINILREIDIVNTLQDNMVKAIV